MKIDFTYLETLSDGDPEFIEEFVRTFEGTVDSLMKKMASELSANKIAELGKSAHQLKPSAKMLGLQSGDQLEEIQNDPSIANASLLAEIHKDCLEGLNALKDWAKEKGVEL